MADIVAGWTGGDVDFISDYEARVSGDAAGAWRVEFDYEFLKSKARNPDEKEGLSKVIDETAEQVLRFGAEQILPMEVVSPPLALERLGKVDELVGLLRDAGAMGTNSSLLFAFGTHLNPELPALDAPTVTAYLKSFLCCYPWLRRNADVDLARRLSLFIEPFSDDYTQLVCSPGYAPTLDVLIDDYLAHNPSRNRVLDMLPLFAHLDEERVRGTIDDPRIKARPTLHYRMPNCEVDRQGWGIGPIWEDWLQVELLAADPPRMGSICRAYGRYLKRGAEESSETWARELDRWLVAVEP